jgi:DNA-binding NarL/FixJ family response regulator
MKGASCLLADDHPALRAAIESYLVETGYDVVGSVPDGARAVANAAETHPDVALIDLRMPRLSGLELARSLREVSPGTKLVIYTAEIGEIEARELVAAGVRGIVLKQAPLADLGQALQAVLKGGSYLDPAIAEAMRKTRLTEREREVLALLAEGLQHEQIAQQLGISAETVRTHLKKASDRLGASTRTQAVATALRLGLIN